MAILEDMRDEFRSSILEYIQDNDCSLDEITEQVPHITIGTLYSILDELEEEQLSLEECQLMVSNVRIILSSSPDWFRPYQLAFSSLGIAATLLSLVTAFSLINRKSPPLRLAIVSITLLLFVDVAGFVAAVNTGPMLRAQYLWPLLLWISVHLCMLVAVIRIEQYDAVDSECRKPETS